MHHFVIIVVGQAFISEVSIHDHRRVPGVGVHSFPPLILDQEHDSLWLSNTYTPPYPDDQFPPPRAIHLDTTKLYDLSNPSGEDPQHASSNVAP